LFGMIAAMGIRHLIEEKVSLANMKNLVIVAIIFIIGVGYAHNGIAYATIAGLLIHWLVPDFTTKNAHKNETATPSGS
jgi:uracil permease